MTPWLSQKRTRPALAAPLPHTAPCTAHPPHRQLQDRAEHTPTVHCICPFHGAGPPPPCPPHPRNLQGFHPLLSTPPPSHFIFSDGACTAPLLFLPVMAPAAPGGTLPPPPRQPPTHPPFAYYPSRQHTAFGAPWILVLFPSARIQPPRFHSPVALACA